MRNQPQYASPGALLLPCSRNKNRFRQVQTFERIGRDSEPCLWVRPRCVDQYPHVVESRERWRQVAGKFSVGANVRNSRQHNMGRRQK